MNVFSNLGNLRVKDLKKWLVTFATLVFQLLALGLVPHAYVAYAVGVLAVLNSVGVYAVRNGDAPALPAPAAEKPAAKPVKKAAKKAPAKKSAGK